MTTAMTRAAPERRRFTVDDCRAMVKAGILAPEEKVELRNGEIFVCRASAQDRTIADHDAGPAAGATPPEDVVFAEASVDTIQRREGIGKLGNLPGAEYAPRRFTVEEYYAMAEAGILAPDERVELQEGEIVAMPPMGDWHAACTADFAELFEESVGRRASKRVQTPLRLNDGYVPEPDLMLLRRRADSYRAGTPRPDDVLLLVEVADSTVESDRQRKLSAYARAGIQEVWLAVRSTHSVEVYAEPVDGVYARVDTVGVGGSVTPTAFPDIVIPVSAVMYE